MKLKNLTQILSHQLVLIYAQSGAGKTSILNAKVIPELEKEGFEVLPIARVGLSSDTYINVENDSKNNHIIISNQYMFNALWSIKPEIDPKLLLNKTLTDFINEYFSKNENDNHLPFSKVIIFDQLEELFSIFPKNWHEEQIMFFKQIADTLNKNPDLRIVFVIREDYLAQLDPFTKILPEKLRPRFRLERLRKDAAIQAIKGPLERANYDVPINEIEQIVQDLMKIKVETITGESLEVIGEFIEPIHLQVVCQRWWHERFIAKYTTKSNSNSNVLSSDLTNVNRALEDFYVKSIHTAVGKTNVKEDKLRRWCEENLITSSGTRSNVHLEADITKGIPNEAIEILADSYLIRREWRSGAPWYELTHDRLIEPIKESNKDWINKKIKYKRTFRIKVAVPIIIIFIIGISLYASSLQEKQNELEQKILEVKQEQELVQSDRLVLQHLTNGIRYLGLGNFRQANSEFTKALSINQSSTDALFYKALTLQRLAEYDQAEFYRNKLKAIDASYIDRLGNTSATIVVGQNSKDQEAITWYDKALAVDPNDTTALNNKGNALYDLGKYEEAITWYDKVLAVDSNYTDALNNKGFALGSLGKYEEAITWYDKALALDPNYTYALNNKAFALANLDKNEEALSLINKVLESNSNDEYYLTTAALIMYNLGKYDDAKSYFEKALQINSNLTDILEGKKLTAFNKLMNNNTKQ